MKTKKLSVAFLAVAVACFLFAGMFFIQGVSAAEEESDILMETGASVRYKVPDEETDLSGIRFSAYVSENYKAENQSAQYGMLLIPASLLGGGELTAQTENAVSSVAEVWRAESDMEGYDKFSTVLYGIPETQYGEVIVARAYIKNGEEYTYAESERRSIAQVANEAIKAGDEHSELLAYVDGALQELSVPESVELLIGGTEKLSVTVSPAELVPAYSSDSEIVSVSADGTITAEAKGTAEISVTVGSTVKTVSVTVKDPADTPLAGAPIREIACVGEDAAEFDIASLTTTDGKYYEGTVTNKDGGEVNYKEGEENILLVKAGETYEFENAFGKIEIRGTTKTGDYYFDFTNPADADLVEITAGDHYGKVSWNGEAQAISSAWDGSRAFDLQFRSDGLVSSENERILAIGLGDRNNSVAYTVEVTPSDISGTYDIPSVTVSVPAWASAVLYVKIPAGMPLSDLHLKLVKSGSVTMPMTGFRIVDAANAVYADFSLTTDATNIYGPDAGSIFSVSNEVFVKSWDKVKAEFVLRFSAFLTGLQPADTVKFQFDFVSLSGGYTIDIEVNGETQTCSGSAVQTLTFEMTAEQAAAFEINFDMKKGDALDGYGTLKLDNFRFVFE